MMVRTADFQDSNFDGIDDRDQNFNSPPMQDMLARPPKELLLRRPINTEVQPVLPGGRFFPSFNFLNSYKNQMPRLGGGIGGFFGGNRFGNPFGFPMMNPFMNRFPMMPPLGGGFGTPFGNPFGNPFGSRFFGGIGNMFPMNNLMPHGGNRFQPITQPIRNIGYGPAPVTPVSQPQPIDSPSLPFQQIDYTPPQRLSIQRQNDGPERNLQLLPMSQTS